MSPTTVTVGGASLAALTSAAMRSSVETTVRCAVVVPVLGHRDRRLRGPAGGDQRLGGVADDLGRRQQHEGRGAGADDRPVDGALGDVDDPHLAVLGGRQRDAGVGGDGADRGDAGDDLERDAGLGAAGRLLGAGGVEERVAVEQPDDRAAGLGGLDDQAGPHGVAERLAVVAERAVDDLDVRRGRSGGRRPRPATRSRRRPRARAARRRARSAARGHRARRRRRRRSPAPATASSPWTPW